LTVQYAAVCQSLTMIQRDIHHKTQQIGTPGASRHKNHCFADAGIGQPTWPGNPTGSSSAPVTNIKPLPAAIIKA
jgi:hypothetical protein